MPARSTTSPRLAWRLPTARTSVAASTYSARAGRNPATNRRRPTGRRKPAACPSARLRHPRRLRSARSDGGLAGLFNQGPRKPDTRASGPSPDIVTTSKVSSTLSERGVAAGGAGAARSGPVVGSNVAFFGDRLSCKIYVEDFVAEVESRARRGERAKLMQSFEARLKLLPESVDGILCWNLFDFLDRPTGQALAGRLARRLRQGGALYGWFGTTAIISPPTRDSSSKRWTGSGCVRIRRPRAAERPHRDIIKMFDGLVVAESVLLKSSTRGRCSGKPRNLILSCRYGSSHRRPCSAISALATTMRGHEGRRAEPGGRCHPGRHLPRSAGARHSGRGVGAGGFV